MRIELACYPDYFTVWKNIQAPLEELMRYIRTRYLLTAHRDLMLGRQRILKELLDAFVASQSPLELLPSHAEFAAMEVFQSILESPVDVEVTKASFLEPVSRLPELAEKWRQSTMQQLLELVPKASKTSQLSLATTIFLCGECSEPILFPRILVHSCMIRSHFRTGKGKGERLCSWQLGGEPWNFGGGKVKFADAASEASRQLVTTSGGNAKKMTAAEMHSQDSRFECLRCDQAERPVMTWWQSVRILCVAVRFRESHEYWRYRSNTIGMPMSPEVQAIGSVWMKRAK